MLVDVMGFVGRGEHLALVDVIDAELLQNLRLSKVADARTPAMTGIEHRSHNLADLLGEAIRATPPSARIWWYVLDNYYRGGASPSAISACLASVTSTTTSPLNIFSKTGF